MTYIPVIFPSVVIVEESLCAVQHHRTVTQMMPSWTMRCVWHQSLGQEYLVAINMITNCTLLKFNINFVLFVRLHNCLCVCEGSVFVGTLRKYFQSNGAQMLLTSQWCFCGELGPWWTHGLGLIYKLHFELLSPHIPKTSPLESRQSDKLITESGNRIEKAEG